MLLTRFAIAAPRFTLPQAELLAWLAAAHATAEATRRGLDAAARADCEAHIARALARCGCKPEQIARRGLSIPDFGSRAFAGPLYDLRAHPGGAGTEARTRAFAEIVGAYFAAAYAEDGEPPDDLVHVTCTGYASPTGAQQLVARRGWGARTRVTNAYQMGCYAAIPALRIAAGFVASGARRVDVAHTEVCSLHFDPRDHALEQLVVHSLFADGFVRYAMVPDGDGAPGLRVVAVREEVLADSAAAMAWRTGDHGMQMVLGRDVPERIAPALAGFVGALLRAAGRDPDALADVIFAVHPGGPRIVDRVRDGLGLGEAQVAASRAVLFAHGNMSSATLPHIWARLLADPAVPRGAPIASLAFGPGLTVCGAVLEKR